MELSLRLLLALPVLSSAGLNSCGKDDRPGILLLLDPSLEDIVPNITADESKSRAVPTLVEREAKLGQYSLHEFEETNLEWQTFDGQLRNGQVAIYNGYVGRTDYVCQYSCRTGLYNPSLGSYCYYPYGGKEYQGSPFQVLVNKDNFEVLEWKEGYYGSVPPNSVKPCSLELYVGKNKYGLGKVDVVNKAFFLPWGGSEYWYKTYQVLTISKDIYSEHLSDVKYDTDGVQIITYPPETMRKTSITNRDCQQVKGTATLSKTSQVARTWAGGFSVTAGVKTTITAGIPSVFSTGIEISVATTVQFSAGTTYVESITHSLSIEHTVPPNHSCGVSMVGYKYGADIPFTARISRTYGNRETTWTTISGTYKGVNIGDVKAVVDHCEPLPDPTPCH